MRGVSVIIPCYNAGDFLKEAVFSVRESAPTVPYEIIVVDDASTDPQTHRTLETLSRDCPDVRIFSMKENGGQSKARNYAIGVAKYDVILPLDADDKFVRTAGGSYLDKAFDCLSRNPDVFVVITDFAQFGQVNSLCRLFPFHASTHLIKSLIPPFSAFRKSELIEVGGYKESLRFAEDWDITVALMNNRWRNQKPYFVAKPEGVHVLYRIHGSGANASIKERIPRHRTIAALMERSPEIYDALHPGKSAEELGSRTRIITTAFGMAARSPIGLSRLAGSIGLRLAHSRLRIGAHSFEAT